jgi:hypothetical protein
VYEHFPPYARVMRRIGTFVAVALCLLVLAMPVGAAPKRTSSSLTISVLWSVITDGLIRDLPPKNKQSVGDVYWYSASLTNHVPQFGRRSGALVGIEYDRLTVLPAHVYLIRAKSVLPGGKIYSRGRLAGTNPIQSGRVIGGTGWYAGARGSVTDEEIGPLASVDTYHLRLP